MYVSDVLFLTELPPDCIVECSAQGAVDEAVAFWCKELDFTVDRDKAISCLQGYGAWDKKDLELTADETLAERVLWLACGDFGEFVTHCEDAGIDPRTECADNFDPPSGSDIFTLE